MNVDLSPLAKIRRARVIRMLFENEAFRSKLRRKSYARLKYEKDHEQRLAFAMKVAEGKHLEADDD